MSAVVTESEHQTAMSLTNPLASLAAGIPLDPMPPALAPGADRDPAVPHAPAFQVELTDREFSLAAAQRSEILSEHTHAELAPEFARELRDYGHIFTCTAFDRRTTKCARTCCPRTQR